MLKNIINYLDIIRSFLGSIPRYVYISTISISFIYFFCFHYVNVHEVGIRRNLINGELGIDKRPGMYFSLPWVQVAKIDTRPHKICIECGCRNLTCVLVSFNPDGWVEFVDKEGFRYYWWSNRLSFNTSHKNEYRGVVDILKGYSYDNTDYTFITKYQNKVLE